MSAADTKAISIAETEIRRITTEASAAQNYDNPVQFQSPWSGFYITRALSDDWFFAMGGIHLSATGVVTVHKPAEGAQPSITAEYQLHVHDRYNWDGDKSTEIAGITVSDKRMGALHTAGLAREYDIAGSSQVRRFEGDSTVERTGEPARAPGGRDGERSDPTR
ncbi:hypothetical protein [Nocardia sp. NPDC049526]|uniref:hypothetical protein n=1 Tax=Nocardia sp. NPDC049526 TaxID=3364316 RepID=UPI00378A93F3